MSDFQTDPKRELEELPVGDAIQLDLFQSRGNWFLLLIDEATRFKMRDEVKGEEAEPLMEVIFNSWIYLFGPPSRIVMDQQVALMSHETGAEFERLGITKSPRGTTAGKGSDQRTGTGLAERHVGLLKLTMWKVKAELNRQGIIVEDSEVAKESSMAHNLTINYNGATPAMTVFGTLPRSFYSPDSEGTMSVTEALQTDLSVFERAMRIRQTSLAEVQHAIAEDRDLESLDISGAFLKGPSFAEIQKALKKKVIYAPRRAVVNFPPANVWRHLGKFASEFAIKEYQVPDYGLLSNEPVHGLNDAPLAWQLSLGEQPGVYWWCGFKDG